MGLNRSVAMRRSLLIGGNYVNIDIAAHSDIGNRTAPYVNIDIAAHSDIGNRTAPYVNIEQGFFDDPPP